MKMSRRLRFFIFLVIAIIICLVRAKCTQAASESDVASTEDPWYLPYGTEFTPFPIQHDILPEPTPLPNDFFNIRAIQRNYQNTIRANNSQDTTLYFKAYSITKNISSTYVFQDISLSGTTHTSAEPIWIPSYAQEIVDPFDTSGDDNFRGRNEIIYMNRYTYTSFPRRINFRYGSFGWSFQDRPQVDLDRDCIVSYSISAENLNLMLSSTHPQILDDLGVNPSMFDSFLCMAVANVYTHNDMNIMYNLGQFTWSEFKSGVSFDIDLSALLEDETVYYINFSVILDPKSNINPVLEMLYNYYNENQTPSSDRVYGDYVVTGDYIVFSRTVNMTEEKYKMKWYEKILFPDPEWTAEYLDNFVGSLSNSSAFEWAIGFRGLIYDILVGSSSSSRDAVLSMPQLIIMGHTFFSGGTFNLSQFLRSQFPQLLGHVKTATSILITMAFLNSIVGAILGFFGLKLYNGVNGDDVGESD